MVDLLVRLHLEENFGCYCVVGPPNIPLGSFGISADSILEVFPHAPHNWILAIGQIHYEFGFGDDLRGLGLHYRCLLLGLGCLLGLSRFLTFIF